MDFKLGLVNTLFREAVDLKNPDRPSSSAIETMITRSTELHRRRNAYAPISRLVNDVLMMVLALYAESLGSQDGFYGIDQLAVLLCSQVCHSWRTMIHAMPALWTRPDLRHPELVEHTIQYASNLRLHLRISRGMVPSSCTKYFKRARTIIFLKPDPDSEGAFHAALRDGLPELEQLVAQDIDSLPTITSDLFPKLCFLCADGNLLLGQTGRLCHSRLSKLVLYYMRDLADIVKLLQSTPALECFVLLNILRGPIHPVLHSPDPVNLTVHLPHLLQLSVYDNVIFCRYLLTSLDFPSTVKTTLHISSTLQNFKEPSMALRLQAEILSLAQVVQKRYSPRALHPTLNIRWDRWDDAILSFAPNDDDSQRLISLHLGVLPSDLFSDIRDSSLRALQTLTMQLDNCKQTEAEFNADIDKAAGLGYSTR